MYGSEAVRSLRRGLIASVVVMASLAAGLDASRAEPASTNGAWSILIVTEQEVDTLIEDIRAQVAGQRLEGGVHVTDRVAGLLRVQNDHAGRGRFNELLVESQILGGV